MFYIFGQVAGGAPRPVALKKMSNTARTPPWLALPVPAANHGPWDRPTRTHALDDADAVQYKHLAGCSQVCIRRTPTCGGEVLEQPIKVFVLDSCLLFKTRHTPKPDA